MQAVEATTPGAAGRADALPPSGLNSIRFALVLAFLVFLTFPNVVIGLRTFVYRDFGLFSYPVASFARESFWRGELPFWNPYNNCGLPFLAQWNTMVLYPPALLYLLTPLSWGLPLFCLLHLFWGGLGMYLLARHWTNSSVGAALAGIIFAFNGLTLNFLMWPSHVATFSWVPWVIWLGQTGLRRGGRHLALAITAGALQMLAGGPETLLVTWMLLGLLAALDGWHKQAPRWQITLRFVTMAATVALVCAPQLLPFLELLAHSQRDSGYGNLARNWSLPIWGWANFLVPLFRTTPTPQGVFFQPQQYWTSSYYAGIGTVWLGLLAVWRARDPRVRWLAGLALLAALLALGDSAGIYRAFRSILPVIEIIRYPAKFVIVVLVVTPILAAYGCSGLQDQPRPWGRFEWATTVGLLLAIGGILALAWHDSPEAWRWTWQSGLSRAVFLLLEVALLWVYARSAPASAEATGSRQIEPPFRRTLLAGGLFLLVFYLDLVTHVPNQNPTVSNTVYSPGLVRAHFRWNPGPALGRSRAMAAPAAQYALKYRAISDPEKNYLLERVGLLADCNLLEDVPQVHGFFSLTPGDINDITVAPYVLTNRDYSRLLDFMGASCLVTEDFESVPRPGALPLVTSGQKPLFAKPRDTFDALTQTNIDLARFVFLPENARGKISAGPQPGARVSRSEFTAHRVSFTVTTAGPSLAVISQTDYPAWKAYLDGKPTRIWQANYAFQALEVPAGEHNIELRYEDRLFTIGVVCSALGILALLGLSSGRVFAPWRRRVEPVASSSGG